MGTTEPKKFLSYAAHCQILDLQEPSEAEIAAFVEKETPLAAGAEGCIIRYTNGYLRAGEIIHNDRYTVAFKNAATGCLQFEEDKMYVVSEEYLQSAIVEREEKCPITGGNRWVKQRVDPELRDLQSDPLREPS